MKGETNKQRYDRLRAEGRCFVCGKDAGGKARCQDCKARQNAYAKKFRANRIKNKLCVACGKPAVTWSKTSTSRYCNEHLDKMVEHMRLKRLKQLKLEDQDLDFAGRIKRLTRHKDLRTITKR